MHEAAAALLQGQEPPPLDLEQRESVMAYVRYVQDLVRSTGGDLLVEQRLPIGHITGEEGAHGTSDAVILAGGELIIVDAKFGRGVPVSAEDNPQLQIYALAALREFEALGDFTSARLVIHQPRLNAVSEWPTPIADLRAFAVFVGVAASDTRALGANLVPGDAQCKFCKAKANCPALAARVQEEIGADFDVIATSSATQVIEPIKTGGADDLARALAAADLIEQWLKAVRAEVETRLLAGQPVPGFKLVQGKKGNRQWTSKDEAEAALKAMRVKHDQMYDYTVISPTAAEKLQKANVIGPRQWPKLAALITQAEGKPSVAPESDKRPALVLNAVADDFENVSTEPACDLV